MKVTFISLRRRCRVFCVFWFLMARRTKKNVLGLQCMQFYALVESAAANHNGMADRMVVALLCCYVLGYMRVCHLVVQIAL